MALQSVARGKRSREDSTSLRQGETLKEHRAPKLARHDVATSLAVPKQMFIRERALNRPQGALRPLLSDRETVRNVHAGKNPISVVQKHAHQSARGKRSAEGSGGPAASVSPRVPTEPVAVGIVGTRLFRTPEHKGLPKKKVRGASSSSRKALQAERADEWSRDAILQSSRAAEERSWCIIFIATMPALLLWVSWLYDFQPVKYEETGRDVRDGNNGSKWGMFARSSANARGGANDILSQRTGSIIEHFTASLFEEEISEALSACHKVALWVLQGLPVLLMMNIITRQKTKIVGLFV